MDTVDAAALVRARRIADLADPSGPRSREICTVEAVADDVRRDAETLVIPSRVIDLGELSGQDFSAAEAG